jgi:hypothetical protein
VSRARRWIRQLSASPGTLIATAAVVGGLLWWQWPLLSGQDSRTDVVLLTDSFLTTTERPVTYRIHEDGRSLEWNGAATSWCDAAAAVRDVAARYNPRAIVLSFASAAGCNARAVDDAVRAAAGHRVVIVSQPSRSGLEESGAGAGATVVDPSRFIGVALQATEMPCQWWETCPADGTVAVRAADGSLTQEGGDRVARMIVAALG